MHSLAFVQLDPAVDNPEDIFHTHMQTKTDSKTMGGRLNVNKGFLRTKGSKEKREGEREGMGKTNISKGMEQIKAILFSKTTKVRVGPTSSLRNPAKSLQAGNPFSPLNEGDEQLGLQKRDPVQKMEAYTKQQEAPRSAAQDAWLGLSAHPALQDMFSIRLLKSLHPQSWGTNYSTTTWHN